jgi:hypothetical protein
MSADFDRWLQNNPNDREFCETHKQAKPCAACLVEHLDEIEEEKYARRYKAL